MAELASLLATIAMHKTRGCPLGNSRSNCSASQRLHNSYPTGSRVDQRGRLHAAAKSSGRIASLR